MQTCYLLAAHSPPHRSKHPWTGFPKSSCITFLPPSGKVFFPFQCLKYRVDNNRRCRSWDCTTALATPLGSIMQPTPSPNKLSSSSILFLVPKISTERHRPRNPRVQAICSASEETHLLFVGTVRELQDKRWRSVGR